MSRAAEESMCPDERLVALVQGALDGAEAAALEDHVERCAICARELRWLSAEQVMFSARADAAPPLPAGVWDQIEDKLAARRAPAVRPRAVRRRTAWLAGTSLAAAAAVLAFFVVDGQLGQRSGPAHVQVSHDRVASADAGTAPVVTGTGQAAAALDAADRDLDQAIAQLQQDYQRRRAKLPPARARRYDEEFTTALSAVEQARSQAGQDVSARRQVVRARARYLRSIQTVVLREGH
jgi:anti-sigma factor RsiW